MSSTLLPDELLFILRSSGLPWKVEQGSRHQKIVLAGRLVGIWPNTYRHRNSPGRAYQNLRAQLRRAVKELRA